MGSECRVLRVVGLVVMLARHTKLRRGRRQRSVRAAAGGMDSSIELKSLNLTMKILEMLQMCP